MYENISSVDDTVSDVNKHTSFVRKVKIFKLSVNFVATVQCPKDIKKSIKGVLFACSGISPSTMHTSVEVRYKT